MNTEIDASGAGQWHELAVLSGRSKEENQRGEMYFLIVHLFNTRTSIHQIQRPLWILGSYVSCPEKLQQFQRLRPEIQNACMYFMF